MTPAEYGRHLAAALPPISEDVVEAAARLLAGVVRESDAA